MGVSGTTPPTDPTDADPPAAWRRSADPSAAWPGPEEPEHLDPTWPGPDEPEEQAPPATRRAFVGAVASVSTAALLAVASLLPVPYAVSTPGSTMDTLGEVDGEPLIQIEGTPTYPSTGELRLTTVSSSGGPGYPTTMVRAIRGWLSPSSAVDLVENVYTPGETQESIDERNQAQMVSSQENASVAALEALGYTVPTTLVVAGAVEGSGAVGVVQEGDVVISLDGEPTPNFAALSRLIAEVPAGQTVRLGVLREGLEHELRVVTSADTAGDTMLGVFIDPEFDMPVQVAIQIDRVGGSSAGTMFALGIMDKLTPEDEAAGQHIAGTGTMDLVGRVGAIGGIRQKVAGARRDGADWFLAPAVHCGQLEGFVPDGLRVVPVSTLTEAWQAVIAIGAGDGETLPSCGDS